MHPQRPGGPSPDRRSRSSRMSAARRAHLCASSEFGSLAALGAFRLLLPATLLAAALVLTVRYPWAVALAAAAAIWLVWPLLGFASFDGRPTERAVFRLALRYLGGHPACPAPGRALLTAWPSDGAATLRVGKHIVAFPLTAVRSVSLADGRIEMPTGAGGWVAAIWGRVLARGVGRFCGLRSTPGGTYAILDRSRVICELTRGQAPCRMVLTGPRGGGEEIYLEALVLLRPSDADRGEGAPGGTRGGHTTRGA